MRLHEAREAYYSYTGKAGDVGRQLALGGIAAVWLLHGGPTSLVFPKGLLVALACFLFSLTFDFFQYFVSAVIWGIFQRYKEKQFKREKINEEGAWGEFEAPDWMNRPGIGLFLVKALSLIAGGVSLIAYIVGKAGAA